MWLLNKYLRCKAKDLKPLHKLLLQVDVAYDADKNLETLDLSKSDLNDLHLDAIANGIENALKKTSYVQNKNFHRNLRCLTLNVLLARDS